MAEQPLALDAGGPDDESALAELVEDRTAQSPAEETLRSSERAIVRGMVAMLPDRERVLLERRFGLDGADPSTLRELSDELGITRERVRQLEAAALRKLAALPEAGTVA
jgi:RNA polymerase primary sigma factor